MEIAKYITDRISQDSIKNLFLYTLKCGQENYEFIKLEGAASGINCVEVGKLALERLAENAIEEGCVYVRESKGNNLSWKVDEGPIAWKPIIKWDFRKYGIGVRKITPE